MKVVRRMVNQNIFESVISWTVRYMLPEVLEVWQTINIAMVKLNTIVAHRIIAWFQSLINTQKMKFE